MELFPGSFNEKLCEQLLVSCIPVRPYSRFFHILYPFNFYPYYLVSCLFLMLCIPVMSKYSRHFEKRKSFFLVQECLRAQWKQKCKQAQLWVFFLVQWLNCLLLHVVWVFWSRSVLGRRMQSLQLSWVKIISVLNFVGKLSLYIYPYGCCVCVLLCKGDTKSQCRTQLTLFLYFSRHIWRSG